MKLFSSITDSSVWSESAEICKVWVTMLAMSDAHGYVGASVLGIANRSQVPLAVAEEALAKFGAPDPHSRSEEYEGRRVKKVSRGYLLLNYAKFRRIRQEEERREYRRQWMAEKRAERATRPVEPHPSDPANRSAPEVPPLQLEFEPTRPPPKPAKARGKAKERKPDPASTQPAVTGFHQLFLEHRGVAPDWPVKNARLIHDLAGRHGVLEVLRRAEIMFHLGKNRKFPVELGGDVGTLAAHFDKFATRGGGGGGFDNVMDALRAMEADERGRQDE